MQHTKNTFNHAINIFLIVFFSIYSINSIAKNSLSKPAISTGNDLSGKPCKQLPQGYGPYDYLERHMFPDELKLVESTHFHPEIENLIEKTRHTGELYGDLDYTLRAWPNHERALLSVIRYQIKLNRKLLNNPIPLETPPECYLNRAIRFNQDDPAPPTLMGYYLRAIGKYKEAKEYYVKALALSPDNSKIEYSYGLLLIDLKNYDEALKYATRSYTHGNPPKGLQNQLKKLGVWIQN